MNDENEKLPSDAEDGGLKPIDPKDREPSAPPPDEKKTEQDPSKQPS